MSQPLRSTGHHRGTSTLNSATWPPARGLRLVCVHPHPTSSLGSSALGSWPLLEHSALDMGLHLHSPLHPSRAPLIHTTSTAPAWETPCPALPRVAGPSAVPQGTLLGRCQERLEREVEGCWRILGGETAQPGLTFPHLEGTGVVAAGARPPRALESWLGSEDPQGVCPTHTH